MTRDAHATNSPVGKIESLWAKGNYSTEAISAKLNLDRDYVAHTIRLIRAHSRLAPEAVGDDEKHLDRIRKHHGTGFPYYPQAKIEAAGL